MKRTYKKHPKRRTKRSSVLSSVFLAVSWLIAFLTVILCGHAVLEQSQIPEAAALQSSQVFAVREPSGIDATFRKIKAINSLRSKEPTILIYHTHTTEAYFPTVQNPYKEAGKWRTNDNTKNVVKVGEALKEILEREYGFCVIHDMTNHEPPKLATSYDRSLVTMQKYHEMYPSIRLFIDLHRDAYQDPTAPADYVEINGTQTARLMFVVGKGEKYSDKPFLSSNTELTEFMTSYLQSINPKLARPIRVKPGRYNQHVAPNCILVEVGHNANTLEQAIAAAPYLAESIAYAFASCSVVETWAPN